MKLYTKTGDDGSTGLFGGGRILKASTRVDAYGTIDETNAFIGVARATHLAHAIDEVLGRVQEDLFAVGAELACVPGKEDKLPGSLIGEDEIARLEAAIDAADAACPPLANFVLPGGSPQAAALHVARTVARRAERGVLEVADGPVRREVIVYLNRLSDLLFALARQSNVTAGVPELPWKPRG
jgi:cob(I)alamin adenosyltransferase